MTAPPPGGGLRKVRRATFVQVPSDTVGDRRLSFRARGVLAWLLDKPDGWDVKATVIAEHGTEGREAVEAALRELRRYGYYRLERRQLPGGTYAMGTAVAESPDAEWAASHEAHGGRAVPVRVLPDGTVVEAPAPSPGTGFRAPVERHPEHRPPVDRSPTQTDTQTDTQGGDIPGDVTRVPSPVDGPPLRTCGKWPTPHGACGACAADREAQAAWEAAAHRDALDRAYAAAEAQRLALVEERRLNEAELGACALCDEHGTAVVVTPGQADTLVVCQHNADSNRRALDARRATRAALNAARDRRRGRGTEEA